LPFVGLLVKIRIPALPDPDDPFPVMDNEALHFFSSVIEMACSLICTVVDALAVFACIL
jgi:hypothetical protein